MKILFITAHQYLPQMFGGLQQSANALMTSLQKKGHHVAILCSLSPNGMMGKIGRLKIKLSKDKMAKDTGCGYPVYRAWFPWENVSAVVKQEKPDVIVVLARMPVKMALAARKTGIPIIMMLQDVEFAEHGGEFKELGDITCVANSAFTAGKYRDEYGVNPHVIHPLIFPERYKTDTTREYVTYINPLPLKGVDIALAVAKACPEIPFLFQESWALAPEELSNLNQKLATLPNVTFQHSSPDMRDVYKRTKILLVPSTWEEAYGRVVSEVQISGIPVVASHIGGLPEAVGNGGILLDPKGDIAPWIEAVKKLWSDESYYQTMKEASLVHANRPSLNTDTQLDAWEQLLLSVSQKGNIGINLISVVIPFYQREQDILKKSLDSILQQQLPYGWSVEVVIVDDGSPISAKNEMTGISQKDGFVFRIIEQKNMGVSGARNRGLSEISGQTTLIAFLDSDDIWPEGYLENAVNAFNLGYDLCFTDNKRGGFHESHIKDQAQKTIALAQQSAPHKDLYNLPSADFMGLIIEEFPCQLSTVTYKKSVANNLRFEGGLKFAGEDMLFMLILASKCKAISCNLDMAVECGAGINMYFSNLGWNAPKFLHILFDRLKCYYLISQLTGLPQPVMITNRVSLKTTFKDSFFHVARYIYKNKGALPKNIMSFIRLIPPVLKAILLK